VFLYGAFVPVYKSVSNKRVVILGPCLMVNKLLLCYSKLDLLMC
jgi:hypothetical protein